MPNQLTWRRLTPEIQLESDGLYENNSKYLEGNLNAKRHGN